VIASSQRFRIAFTRAMKLLGQGQLAMASANSQSRTQPTSENDSFQAYQLATLTVSAA
jgi:hypothetical protein